jgi:hypothetical protein
VGAREYPTKPIDVRQFLAVTDGQLDSADPDASS